MEFEKKSSKTINNLLSSPKTRIAGLHLLDSYLLNCSDNDILEYCIGWMQNCCKIDTDNKDRDFAIEILGKILHLSANYPQLNKSVSFFISKRFSDYFFKYLTNSDFGWTCVKICFLNYRGSCGPLQETFEKHLFSHFSRNVKISPVISQCFALLPSLGGCGKEKIVYQTNWKNQFLKFINIAHLILNDLFENVEELNEYGSPDDSYYKNTNTEFLLIQFQNYCSVIIDMLLIKYPGIKLISTDLVLELVCRGLAINSKMIQKNDTRTSINLKKKLVDIHITLLNVLNALIITCKIQLLPYSLLVCKLVKQTLSWNQSDYGSEKCYGLLRIYVYQVMCNWLIETKTGGCIDTISKFIIAQIIRDIKYKKSVLLLKELKSSPKCDSLTNEPSNRRINFSANSSLCYAALKALQNFLKFYGAFLEMDDQKFLQETIIKLTVNIQIDFSSEVSIPYSVTHCRKALYCVLFELVQQPCPKWPPPTHFALRIFKRGLNDKCPEVSSFCSSALNVIANIIHQQYLNGPIVNVETAQNQYQNIESFFALIEKENNSCEQFPEQEEIAHENEEQTSEIPSESSQNINNENIMQLEKKDSNNLALSRAENYDSLATTSEEVKNSQRTPDKADKQMMFTKDNPLEDAEVEEKNGNGDFNNVEITNNINNEENNERQSTSSVETVEKDEDLHRKKSKIVEKEDDIILDETFRINNKRQSTSSVETVEKDEELYRQKSKIVEKEDDIILDETFRINNKRQSTSSVETIEKDEELHRKKSKIIEKENDIIVEKDCTINIVSQKTPEKLKKTEGNSSEDSSSCHSVVSERRYFLRSKTIEGTSEDIKENLKRTSTPDLIKTTPGRGLGKNTPLSVNTIKHRPRTRALSKLEIDEREAEFSTPKKSKNSKTKQNENDEDDDDDDDDIIEVFDDTIID